MKCGKECKGNKIHLNLGTNPMADTSRQIWWHKLCFSKILKCFLYTVELDFKRTNLALRTKLLMTKLAKIALKSAKI